MAIGHALPFLSEQKERLQSDNEKRGRLCGFCLPRSGFVQQLGQPDGGEQRCANRGKFSGRRWLPLALGYKLSNSTSLYAISIISGEKYIWGREENLLFTKIFCLSNNWMSLFAVG